MSKAVVISYTKAARKRLKKKMTQEYTYRMLVNGKPEETTASSLAHARNNLYWRTKKLFGFAELSNDAQIFINGKWQTIT